MPESYSAQDHPLYLRVDTSGTHTLIFPGPFQESLAHSDTWEKREHKILISHNVLQAMISH